MTHAHNSWRIIISGCIVCSCCYLLEGICSKNRHSCSFGFLFGENAYAQTGVVLFRRVVIRKKNFTDVSAMNICLFICFIFRFNHTKNWRGDKIYIIMGHHGRNYLGVCLNFDLLRTKQHKKNVSLCVKSITHERIVAFIGKFGYFLEQFNQAIGRFCCNCLKCAK